MTPLVAVVFSGALVGLAVTAHAQVRYVDENGKSHWVNGASQVPEKYRENSVYKPNLMELKEKNDSTMKPLNTTSSNSPSRVKAAEYRPREMNQEQAAICQRVWADKANRTLGH